MRVCVWLAAPGRPSYNPLDQKDWGAGRNKKGPNRTGGAKAGHTSTPASQCYTKITRLSFGTFGRMND